MALTQSADDTKPKKRYSPEQAYVRICKYCAYQERSHKEVRNKLFTYGLYPSEVEQALTRLITDGFLNEERFAKAFAGGKFRMKKWGKKKISRALEAHGVSPRCIQRGLKEIDDPNYSKTLKSLLTKKIAALNEPNAFKKMHKAATFAIGKGYEPDLVWVLVKELMSE
jgi:regulatory protein